MQETTITLPPPEQHAAEPMLVPSAGRPWTGADLLALADDERRFEIVQGSLLMMSPASPAHGEYAALLAAALIAHVYPCKLGRVYVSEPGFKLQSAPTETIRAPDVAFISSPRIPPKEQQQGFWALAPDLVIEIVSPSETASTVQEKVRDYLAAGTRLLWLVYPGTSSVLEYQATGPIRQYGIDDSLQGGDVLPGFVYALRELFGEA